MKALLVSDNANNVRAIITRKDIAVLSTTAVVLIACCWFADYAAAGIVALVVAVICMLYQAFCRPAMVFKYLYFAFAVTANILGSVVCEFSNLYLSEVETYAHYCGSIPLLVLSQLVFFVALFLCDVLWGVEKNSSEAEEVSTLRSVVFRMALIAVFGASAALFASVAGNPSFTLGYDRFEYEAKFGVEWASTLAGWLSFLVIVPAYAIRRHEKVPDVVLGCASVVLFALYHVWVGDKFGSFFSLACVFALAYYDVALKLSLKVLRVALCAVLLAFIALLGFAYFAYTFTYDESIDEYFSARIAQQGQLWWRTYDLCDGEMHPDKLANEVEALRNPKSEITENVGSQNGIYGIMYFTTSKKRVDGKLKSGSRFTEAGYASVYYYLGPFGTILFALIAGFGYGAVQNAVLRSLWARRLIESSIWLRLSFQLQTAVSMFTFYMLFTPLSIACYVFLVVSAVVRRVGGGRPHKAAHSREKTAS